MTTSLALGLWDALDPDGPATVAWAREPDDRVALLLGAFDPVTNAHLSVVTAAARLLGLAPALCMTKVLLARGTDELFRVDERVRILERVSARCDFALAFANRGTYIDVGRSLADANIDATFVIGSDKLAQLQDPSFYADGRRGVDATFDELHFAVVVRPGAPVDRDDVDVLDPAEVFADSGTASLSGTEVRARVRHGERVDDLVPPEVAVALGGYTSAE